MDGRYDCMDTSQSGSCFADLVCSIYSSNATIAPNRWPNSSTYDVVKV